MTGRERFLGGVRVLRWQEVLQWRFPDAEQTYSERDAILYALGLGYGHDPLDQDELRYVYEGHRDGLRAVPSMATILGGPGPWMRDSRTGIDWVRSLNGEQGLIVHAPLPAAARVIGRNRVVDIVDKGQDKGALLMMERDIVDASTGTLLATRTSTSFLRGDGGCGAPRREIPRPVPFPDRPADHRVSMPTRPEAALLYRLSGDDNPVHADPEVARRAGFDRPLLHGLCTFGMACRALVASVCGGDCRRLRSLAGRFSKPVFPGDTLEAEIWEQPGGNARFRLRVAERDAVVLDHGVAAFE